MYEMTANNSIGSEFTDPREIGGRRRRYALTSGEVEDATRLANDIVGSDEPVAAIVMHVHRSIRPAYGISRYKRGLFAILNEGRGDCLEVSAVTAMLLRAAGIPCRFISEISAVNFEPGAALAALVPSVPASAVSNSHVWLETWKDGWHPADAQFGVIGMSSWRSARLQPRGGHFGFRFPLQLKALNSEGSPDEDLSESYLVRPFQMFKDSDAFRQWEADLAHFRDMSRSTPFLGARLMLEMPRLRRMSRCLAALLAMASR